MEFESKSCIISFLFSAETTLPETAWGFPVTKDSPYADAISYAVMKMLESGFIEDMQKSYEAKLFECSTSVDSGSVGSK